MKPILEYQDYRAYIQDYYDEMKSRHALSWRLFAKQAGFASCSYLKLICQNKANLSENGIDQVIKAMGLAGFEADYFTALVHFNQAKKLGDRQESLKVLSEIAQVHKVNILDEQMFAYFSSWLNPVMRELVPSVSSVKPSEIVRRLVPEVSSSEVKSAIHFLVKKGFLIQNEDGSYRQSEKSISSGNKDAASIALRSYHKQMGRLAIESLDSVPVDERNFSELLIGVTKKAYLQILDEMADFRRKVISIATQDDGIDRVYSLNLQLFPLTKKNTSKNEASSTCVEAFRQLC